jgi:hypothetical protein
VRRFNHDVRHLVILPKPDQASSPKTGPRKRTGV